MAATIVSLDAYRVRRALRGAPPPRAATPTTPRPIVLCHRCGRPIRSGQGRYPLPKLRAARRCADCYVPF
jgi:hypothetical protein